MRRTALGSSQSHPPQQPIVLSFPDLTERVHHDEIMDDVSITDARLSGALRDLRLTNRFLGGYASTGALLDPLFEASDQVRIVDVGTGGGDSLADLVLRGDRLGCRVEAIGVDLNAGAVEYAESFLDEALPPSLRDRAAVVQGDALDLPFAAGRFDVAVSALFLHHFDRVDATQVLREMDRVTQRGLVVNDLHRHWLAYASIVVLSRLLPVSDMYRHDAPLSVRRGFTREELHVLADHARLGPAAVQWHWAFRWTLSTI